MYKGNFMETNLVLEGIKFMGLGMGTVFTFLVIMILCMNIMSVIIDKYFPEPKAGAKTTNPAPKDNKKIVAAITAAIKHHRG
jgi:oxaloacetate decarboxylase gamma subunit